LEGTYSDQTQGKRKKSLSHRLLNGVFNRSRKRAIRFGILTANIALLAAVLLFVSHSSNAGQAVGGQNSVLNTAGSSIIDPLDQLSSADVAVNVARLANLPEAVSATNHADTVNALLTISPSDQTVVAKPDIVTTVFKSNKDIQVYITKAGDTVSSLASRFHVTSDSIINSNGLAGNSLAAGKTLYIPPVNGIVYVVKGGDTPTSLANKYNANSQQIIAYNDAELGGLKVGERIIVPNGVIPVVTVTQGFDFVASFGANGYDFGWCTWYVANRRAQLGHPVPSNLGDAYSWFILAQRAGLSTGYTPKVGAVAVNQAGDHVSVVERVNADGSL